MKTAVRVGGCFYFKRGDDRLEPLGVCVCGSVQWTVEPHTV